MAGRSVPDPEAALWTWPSCYLIILLPGQCDTAMGDYQLAEAKVTRALDEFAFQLEQGHAYTLLTLSTPSIWRQLQGRRHESRDSFLTSARSDRSLQPQGSPSGSNHTFRLQQDRESRLRERLEIRKSVLTVPEELQGAGSEQVLQAAPSRLRLGLQLL